MTFRGGNVKSAIIRGNDMDCTWHLRGMHLKDS